MAYNCKNCKFHKVEWEWDDEVEDEVEIETCKKGHELPCENDFYCPDFEEYKEKPYKEKFSECDCCQYVSSCANVIESTTKYDMRKHFVRGSGGYCRKESGALEDKRLTEIIELSEKLNCVDIKNCKEFFRKAVKKFGDITYKEFMNDKIYDMYED